MEATRIPDKFGNLWQYHSRSDAHSKAACWAILFDLLLESAPMRDDAVQGKIAFGINHQMHDFVNMRKKDLDLVICRPSDKLSKKREKRSFAELRRHYRVVLDPTQEKLLEGLPVFMEAPVGSVLMALEAKACMTAHIKALPRLYDELTSSHMTVHGNSASAIAVGFSIVNVSKTFLSPGLNHHDLALTTPNVSFHRQPEDAKRTVSKVEEILRSAKAGDPGFDALGIVLIDMANDGGKVRVVEPPPASCPISPLLSYDSMIERTVGWYSSRFPRL
jgi:hypothetical protein